MKKVFIVGIIASVFFSSFGASMQKTHTEYRFGSLVEGNYLWSCAMNLAWHELKDSIIKKPIKVKSRDAAVLKIVSQFNNASFTKNDLDPASYYIKSGFGQQTVELINAQTAEKFPGKTFSSLKLQLQPTDIIAYAYFLKSVRYNTQFDRGEVQFLKSKVSGFRAASQSQTQTVSVLHYWNNDKFIMSLLLQDTSDQLIIAKGFPMQQPTMVLSQLSKLTKNNPSPIKDNEEFAMPTLKLAHTRSYAQLKGLAIANKGFEQHRIEEMYENIAVTIDHTGATVENEAVIALPAAIAEPPAAPVRSFLLDKPFWVIMTRSSSTEPYFLLGVTTTSFMETIP
ncbi:MAG: hypothetical protein JW795_19950 [Chitinivibrionales bacterium]|nr:hypothetical protein [Chitinivibrionales bacterium]